MKPIPVSTKASGLEALVNEIHQAAERRRLSAQGPGRPMQRILGQLMRTADGPQSRFAGSKASLAVVSDLVSGKHGPGLMLDAVLEMEADVQWHEKLEPRSVVLKFLAAGRNAMAEERLYPNATDMQAPDKSGLMDFPLALSWLGAGRHPWSNSTFVDLMAGGYGTEMQSKTLKTLLHGVGPSRSMRSLFTMCIQFSNVDLIEQVANLGPPAALIGTGTLEVCTGATTEAGRWLDACSYVKGWDSKDTPSFPREIHYWQHLPIAKRLAEILVALDPDHQHIAGLEGTPTHSFIMEALMKRRIDVTLGAEPARAASSDAHAAARRSRAV